MKSHAKRTAFSLLELLAVVVILGIIAAVVVPRVSSSTTSAKNSANAYNKSVINAAIEQYHINSPTNAWPTALTDLVPTYLPDGVPAHPNGLTYGIDATTHRVTES